MDPDFDLAEDPVSRARAEDPRQLLRERRYHKAPKGPSPNPQPKADECTKSYLIRQNGRKYFDTADGKQKNLGINRSTRSTAQAAVLGLGRSPSSKSSGSLGLGLQAARAGEKKSGPKPALGLGLAKRGLGQGVGDGPAKAPDLLLVEDVRVSQRIAQMALRRAGYRNVALADSGEQAVVVFKNNYPSFKIVFMDIQLPGITGMDATRAIRRYEREQGQAPPALIFGLTGNVTSNDLANYKECQMNGCIAKGKLLAKAVQEAVKILKDSPDEFVTLTTT